jgi:hypothetical protein
VDDVAPAAEGDLPVIDPLEESGPVMESGEDIPEVP